MNQLFLSSPKHNRPLWKVSVVCLLITLLASLFHNAFAATNQEKAREIAKYGLSVPDKGFTYTLFGGHNNTTYVAKSYYKFSDVSAFDSWLKNATFLVGVTEYFFVKAEGSSVDKSASTNRPVKNSALLISQLVTSRDASTTHNSTRITVKGYPKTATAKYTERTHQTSIGYLPAGSRPTVSETTSDSTACSLGLSVSGKNLGFSYSSTSTYGKTLAVSQNFITTSGKYLYDDNANKTGMYCTYSMDISTERLKTIALQNSYNCTYAFSYETEVTMVNGGGVVNRTTSEAQWDERNARPVCTTSFLVEAELNGRFTSKTITTTFKCPVIATY